MLNYLMEGGYVAKSTNREQMRESAQSASLGNIQKVSVGSARGVSIQSAQGVLQESDQSVSVESAQGVSPGSVQERLRRGASQKLRDLSHVLENLLSALYAHDETPLLSCMMDNCSVITLQGQILKGKEAFRQILPEIKLLPKMRLGETSFHTVGSPHKNDGHALVAGSYQLYSAAKEELLFSAGRQVTACFRWSTTRANVERQSVHADSFDRDTALNVCRGINAAQDGGWFIYHLHFSNIDTQLVNGDVFPIETSRETYDYVRRILHAGRRSGMLPSRVVVKEGMLLHYLDPNDILFIEAQGKHCLVVQVGKQMLVLNELLSEVEAQLPGVFIRVHRSYVVNSTYIQSVERYSLVLTDGTRIPIPKQRFTQIKREIALRVSEV